MPDRQAKYIEVRATEIAEALKACFSNFSVEIRVVEGKGTERE